MSDTALSETEKGRPKIKDGIPIPDRAAWRTVGALLPFMWLDGRWDLRRRVLLALLFLACGRGIGLTLPFIYKDIIDGLSADMSTAELAAFTPVALVLSWGSLMILSIFAFQAQGALMIRVSEAMFRTLATRAFEHVNRLSLGFHLQRSTAVLARIVMRGSRRADDLLRMAVFQVLPMVVEFAVISVLLIANFGWLYASIVVVTGIFYIVFTVLIAEWRKKFRRAYIDAHQESETRFYDAMTNVEPVQNFTNEMHELGRYDGALQKVEDTSVRNEATYIVFNLGQNTIFYLSMVLLMVLVAWEIEADTLTVGSFVLITSLLGQFYRPVEIFAFVYQHLREALIDSEQLLALLGMKPDITDVPNARSLINMGGEIRFENVRFGYSQDRDILRDVNFTAGVGTKVAIVGRTGSGKSTISRLLLRHFNVGGGRIVIDGQNIRDVTLESLRRSIGIVPQETVLFNDTIHYNIEYGRPGAGPDDVIAAAQKAQLHDAILEKEKGYDAVVGEYGLMLSGGEKQRVAIARALLNDPAILILDEATSSLDSHTEQEIQKALDDASKNRTTLVIAHRLSTIMNADQILVLDNGVIAERGTHEALLRQDGIYASMWRRQTALNG